MKKTEEGWITIIDDSLKAGSSNCNVVAFDDFIAIAHASRTDLHLYYTVWDGKENFDESHVTLTTENITIDYVLWVQQFPVVMYEGKNYMCIRKVDDIKDIITSIQRENADYESSLPR